MFPLVAALVVGAPCVGLTQSDTLVEQLERARAELDERGKAPRMVADAERALKAGRVLLAIERLDAARVATGQREWLEEKGERAPKNTSEADVLWIAASEQMGPSNLRIEAMAGRPAPALVRALIDTARVESERLTSASLSPGDDALPGVPRRLGAAIGRVEGTAWLAGLTCEELPRRAPTSALHAALWHLERRAPAGPASRALHGRVGFARTLLHEGRSEAALLQYIEGLRASPGEPRDQVAKMDVLRARSLELRTKLDELGFDVSIGRYYLELADELLEDGDARKAEPLLMNVVPAYVELAAAPRPPPLATLPAFHVRDVGGLWIDSEQLNGKIVVVVFAANWCAEGHRLLAHLGELARERDDVFVLPVIIDSRPSGLEEALAAIAPGLRAVVPTAELLSAFGPVGSAPTTHVFSVRGKYVGTAHGAPDGPWLPIDTPLDARPPTNLERLLDPLLEAAAR